MRNDDEEYEVTVRTQNDEYKYDISIAKKLPENQSDEYAKENTDKLNMPIYGWIILFFAFIFLIIGIFLDIENLILYGTAFSLAYEFFTSNFFSKYDDKFHNVMGVFLNNRKFLYALSMGCGAIVFIIMDIIVKIISCSTGNMFDSNRLIHGGINILVVVSLLFIFFDSFSKGGS